MAIPPTALPSSTDFDAHSSVLSYHSPGSYGFTNNPPISYVSTAALHERTKSLLTKRATSGVSKLQFKPPSILKLHKTIHTNLKSYSCANCPYKSFRKQDLLYHFRTHTGEKPYACPFCPHKSSVMSNMKTHIRRRHSNLS